MHWIAGLLLVGLLAGCGTPAPVSDATLATDETASVSTTTAASTSAPSEFPPGIYYSEPLQEFARLARVDGPLGRDYVLRPNGFALTTSVAISTDSESTLVLLHPDGRQEQVMVPGLFHIGRPSLSPEGTHVAVQATLARELGNEPGQDFDIYLVDLSDGTSQRLSDLHANEESPEWLSNGLVVYSSFDPTTGVGLHVRDTTGKEVSQFAEAGGLHLDASQDGSRILECKRLRILDLATGAVEADLLPRAVRGMEMAGYRKDAKHDGHEHQGSFPLDCAFSPDGTQVVFDGAVTGKGEGILLMQIGVDGSGFRVLAGPIQVDPARSNNNNYSQLNPEWV